MALPADLVYSASRLQDLVECRRRFLLRHVQHLAWPDGPSGREHAQRMQAGARFHQAVQQLLLGVPAEAIAAGLTEEPLLTWWRRFLTEAPRLWDGGPRPQGSAVRAEFELSAPLGPRRLLAKYDLVWVRPDGRVTIVDWKTGGQRPSREQLQGRLQTHVYPLVMALAGHEITAGRAPAPEQIELVYWFTEPGVEPARFPYGAAQLAQDRELLLAWMGEAEHLDPGDDLRTAQLEHCRLCRYTSLCGRASGPAGRQDEADSDGDPDWGWPPSDDWA